MCGSLPWVPAPSLTPAAHLLQRMNTGRDSALQWLSRLSSFVQQRRAGGVGKLGAEEVVGPALILWRGGGWRYSGGQLRPRRISV